MAYDWKITIKKGVKYLLFYGVPGVIASFLQFYPEYSALTVGTLLTMSANWLKHKQ